MRHSKIGRPMSGAGQRQRSSDRPAGSTPRSAALQQADLQGTVSGLFSAISGCEQSQQTACRGRDASYLAPPAQIRTCGFPAYGSHLGYRRQFGAVDEPTSCVTLTRLGVRRVLSWRAFPSVPALRSTNSAADPSALFVGFPATMAGSDFSCPCIIGYGSSPSRCGPSRSRNI